MKNSEFLFEAVSDLIKQINERTESLKQRAEEVAHLKERVEELEDEKFNRE